MIDPAVRKQVTHLRRRLGQLRRHEVSLVICATVLREIETLGGKSMYDRKKQVLYLQGDSVKEIREQAARLDRSMSWVAQQAWQVAREQIKKFAAAGQ